VPGNPDDSLLLKAVRFTDKELQMPPKSAGGKLPPEQIADLEAWVRMGAPDPRTGPTDAKARRTTPRSRQPASTGRFSAWKRRPFPR